MKKIIIYIFILFLSLPMKAQTYEAGQILLSGSYGLIQTRGLTTNAVFNVVTVDYSQKVGGPYYGMLEYLVSPKLGIGLNLAHIRLNGDYTRYDSIKLELADGVYKYRSTSAIFRLNYHLSKSKTLDTYIGIGLGMRFNRHTLNDKGTLIPEALKPFMTFAAPFPGMDCTLGLRYYMTPELGFYFEGGMAKSLLRLGVTYRLSSPTKPKP